MNPEAASLRLFSVDFFGRVHPAFPPHDERHQPMHAIALMMHEELGDASPYHSAPTACVDAAVAKNAQVNDTAAAMRRLEERVAALEAENQVLRKQNSK